MKYSLSILLFSMMLIPKVTSAAAVAGALEPTQIFNNIELIGANISGAGTQLNTLQSAMKSTILDPIANQLINSAIQSASNDILSWANGGFNGEPLIVSNPEKYIRNQGIKSVKLNLNLIPEGSAFGDSLFSSIVKKYAYDNKDMKSKLADLSKSSIPGIIQNDVCDNASLTAYALEKVVASDGTYDPNELAAKKNEIYEYAACDGNVNDPEVQARLQDFAKQNPSLGGWDRWLAMTGGDNEFSRVTAGEELVAEANAREKYLADRNLFDGQKVLSQTSCSEYSQPQEGEDRVCIGTQGVTVPGSIATEIVSKASNAGLDRLTNIMGEGSLSSLLQGFAVQYLTNGINEALNPNAGSNSNNSTTVISQRPIKQDLAGNPAGKAGLTKPMQTQFTLYEKALANLESLDIKFLNDIIPYEQKVEAGAQCYNELVKSGQISSSDPKVAFYKNRQSRINDAKTSINTELPKITEAKNLLAETRSKIDGSNSTQEISNIFNSYMSTIDSRGLPNIQTEAARRGEYTRATSEMSRDTDVVKYYDQCVQMNGSNSGVAF